MAREVRQHSFKNHYLCLLKNASRGQLLRNAPWLAMAEVLRFGYAVLREWDVLPAYLMAGRALPRTWAERRRIARMRRVDPERLWTGEHARP